MGRLRSLRWRLGRIERDSSGKVLILQSDGTIARFSEQDAIDAYAVNMKRFRAFAEGRKEEIPPPHPFQVALLNAAHHEDWHDAYTDFYEAAEVVGDLSEP